MTATTDPERHIVLEGCFNFRDLGGYATETGRRLRWRRLFRADGLYRMTETDHRVIDPLQLASVIDLRTPDEIDTYGRVAMPADRALYHHFPLFDVIPDWEAAPPVGDDGPAWLADRYVEMLEQGRATVRHVLDLLARSETYPAVFHCAAGKDRTGIVSALILSLLEVADETIVADYALSSEAMTQLIAWFMQRAAAEAQARGEDAPDALGAGSDAVPPPAFRVALASAEPRTMARLLEHIRNQTGSIRAFVADLGVTDEIVDGLRREILEPVAR